MTGAVINRPIAAFRHGTRERHREPQSRRDVDPSIYYFPHRAVFPRREARKNYGWLNRILAIASPGKKRTASGRFYDVFEVL